MQFVDEIGFTDPPGGCMGDELPGDIADYLER